MEKSLKEKAIDIKGKKYVLVADRIIYFNENYPEGYIETQLLSTPEAQIVVMRAIIWPDIKSGRKFVGHSQAVIGEGYINKTSAMENAETSAVGRALAMMGIGVIDSIASVDEINKAKAQGAKFSPKPMLDTPKTIEAQKKRIIQLLTELNMIDPQTYTKEDVEAAVKQKTDLKLLPNEYQEIINRLSILNK